MLNDEAVACLVDPSLADANGKRLGAKSESLKGFLGGACPDGVFTGRLGQREESRMTAASILHMSDLHFGSPGQEAVWNSLKTFINERLKPDLVVVTGDIVDTPSPEAFKNACDSLKQIQANHRRKFLVCPGNHDRHWRGNAFGPFTRWLSVFRKAQNAAPWFSTAFEGHLPRLDQYEDIELNAGTYKWCLRFGGLDSATHAKYLARGYVSLEDLELLQKLRTNIGNVDAVFLLMHHHLLPIAAAESTRQSGADMVAGTTVVNAGKTLGSIVGSQVDIVLHGHEHQRNLARYGTFGTAQGDTVILGCGSSTGAVTLTHNDLGKASSNLIELHEDQSIWVKEVRHDDNGWNVRNDSRICIVPTLNLRRSKFSRRAGGHKMSPTSEVVKHVQFTHQRDIVVRESRTDWLIKGDTFGIVTRNRFGVPANPRVELKLPVGIGASALSPNGFEPTEEPGCYLYRLRLSAPGPMLALNVDVSYEWIDGALLSRQDLELIPQGQRGPFRDDGYDFVALSVTNDLRAFHLNAHLPTGFWPNSVDSTVKVCTQEISSNAPPVERPHLKEHLTTSGLGVLTLSVPYPMTGYRYFLAWRLPEGPSETSTTLRTREVLRSHANEAIEAFREAVAKNPWGEAVSLSLYLPERSQDGTPVVKRIAHVAGQRAAPQPPQTAISLRGAQWVYRHAWWDGDGVAYSETDGQANADALEAGILPGERWLFVLPVREMGAKPGAIPVALLRIGISEKVGGSGPGTVAAEEHFAPVWTKGIISLLHAVSLHT